MPENEDKDLGLLTWMTSRPYFSIPYMIGQGLLHGATPGTARVGRGLHAGLEFGLAAEEAASQRAKEKQFGEALAKFGQPQRVTQPGFDLSQTTFSVPEVPLEQGRLSDIFGPLQEQTLTMQPTRRPKPAQLEPSRTQLGAFGVVPEEPGFTEETQAVTQAETVPGVTAYTQASGQPLLTRPARTPTYERTQEGIALPADVREFVRTIARYNPQLAVNILGRHLAQASSDFSLSPGQARFRGREKIAELPHAPKPWIRIDAGDRYQLLDPDTYEVRREIPKRPAPEHPDREALRQSQIELNEARANRQRALAKRVDALLKSPRGGAAFNEWVVQGGDPEDREGFLEYYAERQGRGSTATETETERAVDPVKQRMAERAIAARAVEMGVHKLSPEEQAEALRAIADDYGMELKGNVGVSAPGMFSRFTPGATDVPVLSGKFSLRPKPLTRRTQRSSAAPSPSRPGAGRPPVRLRFDAEGNPLP